MKARRSPDLLKALNDAFCSAETPEEYQVRQMAKKLYAKKLRKKRS